MLRRFAKYYRPHLPLFLLDFSCAFAMAGLDLVFPVAVQWVIDSILPQQKLALFFQVCAALLGLYLLRALLQYIVDYWGHVLGCAWSTCARTCSIISKSSPSAILTPPRPAISCRAWLTTLTRFPSWPTTAPKTSSSPR